MWSPRPLARDRRAPPGFIEPCQPVLRDVAPAGPDWLNEIKHDGYRLIARKETASVCLWSRNGRNWTSAFSTIVQALEALPGRVVLDGEAVAHRDQGLPDFYWLRSRYGGDSACMYVFDILFLGDRDLRRLPLIERKDELARLLHGAPPGLIATEFIEGNGRAVFEHACKLGLEGIVSKRRDAPYRPGRDPNWRKIKCQGYQRR
jgi:bifunctional non-homologous end joining protein LigD